MLTIHLLGAVQIFNGDKILPPFPTQRSRELFAILASRPNHPHSRASLAGNLWPEKTEDKARASLNTELWRVRQALGKADQCLEFTRDTLALNLPSEQVDIHKFRALVKQGEAAAWKEAVALYRGEFLEGCYADWCLLERESLADQFRLALAGLLRHHEARGELTDAVAIARRLSALDPLREEIHRALMRLFAAQGDRHAALAQYRACQVALKRELGVEPMPETEALFQKISQQAEERDPTHSPVRPERVFVGRAFALQWLDKVWSHAAGGRFHAALVIGESGIGKTRLIERWLDGLQGQAVILRGHCREIHRQAAFHPIREMLQGAAREYGVTALDELPNALLAELTRLAPEIKNQRARLGAPVSLPPAQARERLMEALSRGLRAYAEERRPLVLFFDDLQWADNESLDWIAAFLRAREQRPALLVASYRPDALAASVKMDARVYQLEAESFHLDSLSKPETVELVRGLGKLSDAPNRFAEQVYAETEGNPLFVIETLRGLFDAGYLSEGADGVWAIPLDRQGDAAARLPIPASLREVIRKRVEHLTPNQRRVLSVAAAIGREFETASLLAISEMESPAFGDALRVLVRNGLIVEADGKLNFGHVRVQEYLLEGLEENERRNLHLRVARHLEGRPERPLVQLAFHYQRGGDAARALDCFEQAGERGMEIHAYKMAAAHFESAAALCAQGESARRFESLMKWYACLWATNHDLPQLQAILEQAGRAAQQTGAAESLARASLLRGVNLVSQGQWEEAGAFLEDALQRADPNVPNVELEARLELANILQYKHRFAEAREHLEKALALSNRLSDLRAEARVRWDLNLFDGDAAGQARFALELVERAFHTNTPVILIDLGSSIVGALVRAGNPGEALRQAERMLAFSREQGILSFVKTVQRALARVHVEIGQYESALQLAKEALAASRLTNYRYGEMRALACAGFSNAGLGYFEDALQDLARAAALCEQMDSKMDLAAIRAETASLLVQRGEPAHLSVAEALARQILEEGEGAGRFGYRIFAFWNLARIRLAQGLAQEARSFSDQAVTLMDSPANRDIAPDPRVYFTHFAVLRSLHEDSARAFLQRARVTLFCRAQTLPPSLRRSYLRRVREHCEICEARPR